MEVLRLVSQFYAIIAIPVFIFCGFRLRNQRRAMEKKKKNKVSEMFSELSKEDLKLRKTAIINYQNMYLNTTFKRGIQMLLTVALLASIIGALVTSMLYQDFSTSFLFISALTFCILLLSIIAPSSQKQTQFWENYLNQHPDNPLKIVLLDREDVEKITAIRKKQVINFMVIELAFLIFYVLYF
ncbi:hypothetical protein DSH54_RS03405 [Enterococcus hirae]